MAILIHSSQIQLRLQFIKDISVAKCKTAVTPLLTHKSYCSMLWADWISIHISMAKDKTAISSVFSIDILQSCTKPSRSGAFLILKLKLYHAECFNASKWSWTLTYTNVISGNQVVNLTDSLLVSKKIIHGRGINSSQQTYCPYLWYYHHEIMNTCRVSTRHFQNGVLETYGTD